MEALSCERFECLADQRLYIVNTSEEYANKILEVNDMGMEHELDELKTLCRSKIQSCAIKHNETVNQINLAYFDAFGVPGRKGVLLRCAELLIEPSLFDNILQARSVHPVIVTGITKKRRIRTKRK